MSCPVSSPRSGRFGLIVLEKVLEGAVAGGVVGGVVCQQRQMTPDPGSGEDADGVGVVVASGAGLVVQLSGPGVDVAGVGGEVTQRVPRLLVRTPAEDHGFDLAGLAGRGCDPGQAGEGVRGGEPASRVTDLGQQPGCADRARARQRREDGAVGVDGQLLADASSTSIRATSAKLVADAARQHGITLISPVLLDVCWRARAGLGFHADAFTIDWDTQQVTCPHGHRSSSWIPATQRSHEAIVVRFGTGTCRACPDRDTCTTAQHGGRALTLKPRALHESLRAARTEQDTRSWQVKYRLRARVEGTIGQAVAVTGTRRARYRGLAKTHLEHVYTAAALNLIRVDAYWNDQPLDQHRTSHLARLERRLTTA